MNLIDLALALPEKMSQWQSQINYLSTWNTSGTIPAANIPFGNCLPGISTTEYLLWYGKDYTEDLPDIKKLKLFYEPCDNVARFYIKPSCSFKVNGVWSAFENLNNPVLIKSCDPNTSPGILSGKANNGIVNDSKQNCALIKIKVVIPTDCPSGHVNFIFSHGVLRRR